MKRGLGHIYVTGRADGDDVLLQVTDDGVGMPEERLEQLRQAIADAKRVGFGFSTVHERIRLLFWRRVWTIHIQSKRDWHNDYDSHSQKKKQRG